MEHLFKGHQHWRYMILLFAAIAVVSLLIGVITRKKWRPLGRVTTLLYIIVMDIQVLLGAILWVGKSQWQVPNPSRTWEHPTTMLLAVAFAHIGSVLTKKDELEDSEKYKKALIFFGISAVLVLVGIYRIKGNLP